MAWLLACSTFPLIWMGGMVTTYGAGMAVEGWPDTFGWYLFFLYPLRYWLPGKYWDIFLEHSHRLVGTWVGMVTVGLVVAIWYYDRRRWLRGLAIAALVGVSFQGLLGGLRVNENSLFLAKVHGCTAPVFFALTTALVAFTSSRWLGAGDGTGATGAPSFVPGGRTSRRFSRLALLTTAAIYLQIVLGANLRHIPPDASRQFFRFLVWLHLIVAGMAMIGVLGLLAMALRRLRDHPALVRRAKILTVLLVTQIALGMATWVTRYGIPGWFCDYFWPIDYTVEAKSWLQAIVITAHVGVGSLTLVASLSLALWSLRRAAVCGTDCQSVLRLC